ncbi:MAG: sulfurtransferase TusA family protein [Bacillota bacterium]
MVDARGLLCPEPVLLVKKEMARLGGKGEIRVMVNSGTARENITRLANSQGWKVTVHQQGDETELRLIKQS